MLPFMMGGDKKIASMIVEKKPEVKELSDNETDYSPGKEAAIKDVIKAIESKDAKLLLSGLEDLIAMCMDEYESKEHEDEGEEEESESPKWK
jgi:hypothetical protein